MKIRNQTWKKASGRTSMSNLFTFIYAIRVPT